MTSREKFEAWWEQEKYDDKLNCITGIMFNRIKANMFLSWQASEEAMAVQLANAESKCRELAAENGQMLRLLTDISENHDEYVNADEYLYAGVPMDYVSEINTYVSRDIDAENPFKATDSFLDEVRAQGVDAAIEHLSKKFEGTGRIGVPVIALEWLAQELRKGAAL